jgi:hypothetical protein
MRNGLQMANTLAVGSDDRTSGGDPIGTGIPPVPELGQVVNVRGASWAVAEVKAQGSPRALAGPEFEAEALRTPPTKDATLTKGARRGALPMIIGWRPGGWYVLLLAKLSLPPALRPQRDQLLAGPALDADERVAIDALTALADAVTDASAALGPGQEAAVRRFLFSTTATFRTSYGQRHR